MNNVFIKRITWLVIMLVVWSWGGLEAIAVNAMDQLQEQEQIKLILEAQRLMEAIHKDVPNGIFEPADVVKATGREAGRIFEWLKTETRLVPYRGSLRGAQGVIIDRKGNSLDRAILLYELLKEAGFTVRLCRAALPGEIASDLITVVQKYQAAATAESAPFTAEQAEKELRRYAGQLGIDPEPFVRQYTERQAEMGTLVKAMKDRTSAQSKNLMEKLNAAGVLSQYERYEYSESLKDHWWVQYQVKSDWIDLDPSLPGNQPGDVLIKAEESMTLQKLPQDLKHRIELRVKAERLESDGSKTTETLLSWSAVPSDLFGKRIMLQHVPADPKNADEMSSEIAGIEDFEKAIMICNEWLPLLTVGDRVIYQQAIDASGRIRKFTRKSGIGGVPAGVGGLLGPDALDISSKADSEKGIPTTHFAAEFLEYEITIPGEKPKILKRNIFDLVGATAGSGHSVTPSDLSADLKRLRALTLMGTIDFLVQPCEFTPTYVENVFTEMILSNQKNFQALSETKESDSLESYARVMNNFNLLCGPLYSIALNRTQLNDDPTAFYLAEPNLFAYYVYPRSGSRGEFSMCKSTDIVWNKLVPDPAFHANTFEASLEQGVLDSNVEILALGGCECRRGYSTAEMYEKSYQNWVLIQNPDDLTKHASGLSDGAKAGIEQSLLAGQIVIAPPAPIQISETRNAAGWWTIDPRTGQSLGILDNGGGSVEAEEAIAKWGFFSIVVRNILCNASGIFHPKKPIPGQTTPVFGKTSCFAQSVCDTMVLITVLITKGAWKQLWKPALMEAGCSTSVWLFF